jgi:Holliday junction resolvase
MRRAAKIDANQEAVVIALRATGATVQSLAAIGKGVPDLLVGHQGQTFLIEVKDGKKAPSARQLTEDQVKWHGEWKGGLLTIAEGPEQALKIIGAIK